MVLCTYLVYNTVVQLCQFFCLGGQTNLVRIFLLNQKFLLIHRNKYLEGMDDGQKTPRGHPDFNSYVKLNVFHIPIIFLVNTLLLYSFSPYSQTERQMESQIHSLRVGWRNLFSSCAVVSVFCSGGKLVLVLHTTYVLRVPYSCGVVLVFLVLAVNCFWCYLPT